MKIIYSDGSCIKNPGKGGWGVYLKHNNEEIKVYGYGGQTTNNQMELRAAIIAAQFVDLEEEAIIYSDSQYVIKGIEEWMVGWKKNGWKTKAKEPVKNKELWIELDQLQQQRKIKWTWVKAHNGDFGNETVDKLAKLGSAAQSNEYLLPGFLDFVLKDNAMSSNNTIVDSKNKNKVKAQDFKVFDCVQFKDKIYLIVKEIQNEKTMKGFLLYHADDMVYINDISVLSSVEQNQHTKFSLLNEVKNSFSQLYHDAKEHCIHEIKTSKYESAECEHCESYFGWYCEVSPDHTCHYCSHEGKVQLIDKTYVNTPPDHSGDYETDDSCIFCGQPEERK